MTFEAQCSRCGLAWSGLGCEPCPHCEARKLRGELAQLREQSAREHAAWEAVRNGSVTIIQNVSQIKHGRYVKCSQ